MALTVKQEKFCQEYIRLGSKTEAYKLAYSTKNMKPATVNNKAYALSEKGEIRARIQNLEKEVAERNRISIDELIQSLASMVRFDIADFYDKEGNFLPVNEMPKHARQMIESLDVQELYSEGAVIGQIKKVRTIKKLDAIEKLMKHLGGYEKDNKQKSQDNIVVFRIPDNGRG